MSLVPMLYSDWWEDLDRHHSLIDQHFGMPLDPDEILHRGGGGITNRHVENLGYPFFRRMRRRYHPFHHALSHKHAKQQQQQQRVGTSAICNTDRDRFVVTLDVKQFMLDEITVKTIDKSVIVIEARHDEKEDEHGYISRRFTRKYSLPLNYDIEQIESSLSSDGVLTVAAPRKTMAGDNNERIVKIQYTGEPAILDHQDSPKLHQVRSDDSFHRDHSSQQQQQMHRGGPMMSQQRGKKITVKGV